LQGLLAWVADTVVVYPGHGGHATMAEIRRHNTALHAFLAAA
jgi:glyoxylase-like metal-dependent hydrolase (beta-lactamase superfamily II)